MPRQSKSSMTMLTRGLTIVLTNAVVILGEDLTDQTHVTSMKFDQTLPKSSLTSGSRPRAHHRDLVPQPSILLPHCLAHDRLQLWCPLSSRSDAIGSVEMLELDLKRILDMINVSWARGTKEAYGAGLLVYHVFCDLHNVTEDNRGPASPILIIAFISSCAGSYAESMVANYVFTVQAWHILHGLSLSMDDMQVKAALTDAAVLAPLISRHPKRASVTVDLME